MVCERTWVCHYLQGYPCQLGGETENTRLMLDCWIEGNEKPEPEPMKCPTKERKKQRKAFHLPKYLSYICQYFFFNAFHLSGCSQHFFGRGLKKKKTQLTNSHFGINSCCNQRLEILILSIALVNKKSSHQTEARMVPNRDCGVSVYTINLHFLGPWTQLAISWRHSPRSPHN